MTPILSSIFHKISIEWSHFLFLVEIQFRDYTPNIMKRQVKPHQDSQIPGKGPLPLSWEILAITAMALVMLPVVNFDFVWDDSWLIVNNPAVNGGLGWIDLWLSDAYQGYYYRPLVLLTFRFDYIIGSGSPLPFHVTNLIFNALLLGLFARYLALLGFNRTIRLAVLLIWGMHPLRVESVAFVSARDNLMLAIFAIAALCAFEHALRARNQREVTKWTAILSVLVGLSLFVKELGAFIPLLILWRWACAPSPKPSFVKIFMYLLGVAPFAVIYACLRIYALPEGSAAWQPHIHLMMPLHLLAHYLSVMFWPVGLIADNFDISLWNNHGVTMWRWTGEIALTALLAALFALSWKKHRMAAFGFGWFVLMLAPVLNLIPTPGRLTSDTWLLIPSAGLAIALGWGLKNGLSPLKRRDLWQLFVGILIAIPLASLSAHYLPVWRNNDILYRDIIEKQPENPRPYTWLGFQSLRERKLKTARSLFEGGISANPKFGDNHLGLALTNLMAGKSEVGVQGLKETLRIEPHHEGVTYYLGRYYLENDNPSEALRWLTQARAQDAAYPNRFHLLAEAYKRLGQTEMEKHYLNRFCGYRPTSPVCRNPMSLSGK